MDNPKVPPSSFCNVLLSVCSRRIDLLRFEKVSIEPG